MRCYDMPTEQKCSLSETPKARFVRALDTLMVEHEDEISLADFAEILRDAADEIEHQKQGRI